MNSSDIDRKDKSCIDVTYSDYVLPIKRYNSIPQDLEKKVCIDLTESNLEEGNTQEATEDQRFEVTPWYEASAYYERLEETPHEKYIANTSDNQNEKFRKSVLGFNSAESHKTVQEGSFSPENTQKILPKDISIDPELIDLEEDVHIPLVNQPPIISLLDEETSSIDSDIVIQNSAPGSKSVHRSALVIESDLQLKPQATSIQDLMDMHCITEMAKQYFKLIHQEFKQVNSYSNGKYTSLVYINNQLISFTESNNSNHARAKAVLIAINHQDSHFCEEWLMKNEQYFKDFLGVKD